MKFPRSLLTILLLSGCIDAIYEEGAQLFPDSASASSTGSSSSTSTTGEPTGGIFTVTGDDPSTTTTTSGPMSSSGSTAAEPAEPQIVGVDFMPYPLTQAGTILVDVTAVNTSKVEMVLGDGTLTSLTPAPGGHFAGAIEVITGLDNGEHPATFTPFGEGVGDEKIELYKVMLPMPGSEAVWDASPDVGKGEVKAVRVTSTHILEFGTHQENGATRCYLRRRDLFGKYGDADIVAVLPGKLCMATDLAVGPADEIYLLANVTIAGQTRWWAGQMTTWGQTTKIDEGNAGEIAHALAVGPNGEIVTCGAGLTMMKDLDARYWLTYSGGFGWTRAFDYVPADVKDIFHAFDETIKDCEFSTGKLVMVGEALGKHDKNDPLMAIRKRLGILEVDIHTDEHLWTVADIGPGNMTQSAGTALAINDEGNSIVGLYTCEDQCDPVGEFRIYEPGGVLAEPPITLGADVLPPFSVAWNPAGYIVLASAKGSGWNTEFFVQAYFPGEPLPEWSYSTTEGVGPHLAQSLTFIPGVVIAGGIGGAGYPALAFIYG